MEAALASEAEMAAKGVEVSFWVASCSALDAETWVITEDGSI